jgi:diphthamide biosynthesis protein 2
MSAENTTFFTSGADAISRTIDLQQESTPVEDLDNFYEIERTIAEILAGDYKRVALQFPDELLHDSVPIYRRLKAGIGLGRELYVLADTSYGRHVADTTCAKLLCNYFGTPAAVWTRWPPSTSTRMRWCTTAMRV